MNLGSERSVPESVEDNEEIKKVSVVENLGNIAESTVHENGSCEGINSNNDGLPSDVKGKESEVSASLISPRVEVKSETSPAPSKTRKGYGLKKWRRIKREPGKSRDTSEDAGKMLIQESSESVINPSKRTQVYAERQQKSEGSVSSTKALVGSLDVFALFGDPGLAMAPSIDAGTDSENSEDRSSKSSTAASIPKLKYEIPVAAGFPHDKSRTRGLSGKNLTHSVQRGQQVKVRIEAIKKARGEQVKLEKENSHSSVESDSRSSNFVFMHGTCATSNGIQSDRPVHYDGENGGEVKGGEQEASDGPRGDGKGGSEDISPEVVAADSYYEFMKERGGNQGSSLDQDPLVESIFFLQSAQEALEKELLKFKEISNGMPIKDLVSDIHPECTDVEQKVQETSSEHLPSGVGVQSFSQAFQSEVVEAAKRDMETELEDIFKQKIEAEVEYLAILRTIQKLRVAAVNKTANLEQQKAPPSEQNQIPDKHGDTENKAAMLKKEAEKLENFHEDIASADETLKLQKRVCKYASYFFIQLILLLVILGVFVFQLSPNYVEVVPT